MEVKEIDRKFNILFLAEFLGVALKIVLKVLTAKFLKSFAIKKEENSQNFKDRKLTQKNFETLRCQNFFYNFFVIFSKKFVQQKYFLTNKIFSVHAKNC
jgi:hypothetical protein